MKASGLLLVLLCAVALIGSSGPDDRQVTDPKSVQSATNPEAKPIPIDELFFTRNVGGPSSSNQAITGAGKPGFLNAAGWTVPTEMPRVWAMAL
jgi:hypothetical protein